MGSGGGGAGGGTGGATTSGGGGTGGDGGDGGQGGGQTTASVEVTPEAGGTVSLGGTTVVVPPGAVDVATTISLMEVDPASVAALPAGYASVGPRVALLPHGQIFMQPVQVTLGHTSTAPTRVAVLRLDDEADVTWEPVVGATADATTVTYATTTFSVVTPAEAGPQVIYTVPGTANVGHLALQGNTLYWAVRHDLTHEVEVGSVNTDGSAPNVVVPLTSGFESPGALATSPTNLYFLSTVTTEQLFSVPLGGGTPTDLGSAGSQGNPDLYLGVTRLIFDGTALLYSNYASNGSMLRTFQPDGTPIATLPGIIGATSICEDGSDILYGAYEGVQRVAKTLDPTTVTTEVPSDELESFAVVVGIAQDPSNIYVLTNKSNQSSLWRRPRAGGPAEPVVPAESIAGRARGLLLVDDQLFFTVAIPAQNPELMRVDRVATNATPTTLDVANPLNLCSDGTTIFYGRGTDVVGVGKDWTP
ncbi:MAG: hypothetical protein KC731_02805 [Myxococcales bacterium]|nr:hypothetical protein [Myxococcales bacterium]